MLVTKTDILNALTYYDTHKGFGRRYIYGDPAHITKLRALASQLTNETLTNEQIKHCYLLIAKILALPQSRKKTLSYTIFKSLIPTHFTHDHQDIALASLIYDLNEARLLTHENLSPILTKAYNDLYNIEHAFSALKKIQSLTIENRAAIITNPEHSDNIVRAFYYLKKANLLTKTNSAAINANAKYSDEIARAFCELNKANLLTKASRAAIIHRQRQIFK